jgi:hypothetical protein
MQNRLFVVSQRMKLFLVSLGIVAFIAPSASAALKKYQVRHRIQLNYAETSPKVELRSSSGTGVGLIDESGASPVLTKLVLTTGGGGRTTLVPSLTNGFIWYNQASKEGPSNGQVGAGTTGTNIVWGNLTGWTITGGTYCHAVPSYICDYAVAEEQATVTPDFLSNNYDIGTWTFHGTGFLDVGYINRTGKTGLGNLQWFLIGIDKNDGTVPALPLLGIGAVGVSVFAMGVASIRRRKE